MGEVVDFVAALERRGMAYALEGSVYFDTGAFVRAGQTYGRLQPARQAGHDDGGAEPGPAGRRSPRDFALWKGVRDATPSDATWPSPWGPGRPGWHIECSAMATYVPSGGPGLRRNRMEEERWAWQRLTVGAEGDPAAITLGRRWTCIRAALTYSSRTMTTSWRSARRGTQAWPPSPPAATTTSPGAATLFIGVH
jgi:hypothetical protein